MKLFIFITLFAAFTFKNLVICAHYDDQQTYVIKYLQSFGYLPEDKNTTSISHKQLKHGLKRLQVRKKVFLVFCLFNVDEKIRSQSIGRIPVTGRIDERTLKLMKQPRCGVREVMHNHKRQRRFDLLSEKWDHHHIKWK